MPSIAIIGASNDRTKFGNKAVRAYNQKGWTVFPVNPHEDRIEHMLAYKHVANIDVAPNFASVYLPPSISLKVLDEIAAKGIKSIYLNPGSYDDAVEQKARELGLNVLCECSIRAVGVDPDTL
ncbi:MAG: CoA-binding protein [Candidatus Micrarchaeota archaeon]|nr:CoA-binding protein [Candidatus Micrarchaeota archaeon]